MISPPAPTARRPAGHVTPKAAPPEVPRNPPTLTNSALAAQMAYAVRLQEALFPVASSAAEMVALVNPRSGNSASSTTSPLGLSIVAAHADHRLPAGQGAVVTVASETNGPITATRSRPITGFAQMAYR